MVGKVRLSCFAASQEVWVSRPLISRQNRTAGSGIQGSEVTPGHTAKQGNTGSVASTLSTTLPCLSLPALPFSPISMPCLPLLLRWPNNSLLSVDCLETTCLQPKSCSMPGCQEEDSIPRTEALKDRAAFFLPGSSPSLPNSDGTDAFCEVGTSRLILGSLVPKWMEPLTSWSQFPYSLAPTTFRKRRLHGPYKCPTSCFTWTLTAGGTTTKNPLPQG